MSAETKRALRKRRRAARAAALAIIQAMGDDELRNMRNEIGRELNQQAKLMNEIRTRLDAVKSEIERRRTGTSIGVQISDHAVVRYLERYKGLDMAAIREEIVSMARRAGKLGSGDQYARRTDEETGMTMGLNEITGVVTTMFSEREKIVMQAE